MKKSITFIIIFFIFILNTLGQHREKYGICFYMHNKKISGIQLKRSFQNWLTDELSGKSFEVARIDTCSFSTFTLDDNHIVRYYCTVPKYSALYRISNIWIKRDNWTIKNGRLKRMSIYMVYAERMDTNKTLPTYVRIMSPYNKAIRGKKISKGDILNLSISYITGEENLTEILYYETTLVNPIGHGYFSAINCIYRNIYIRYLNTEIYTVSCDNLKGLKYYTLPSK